MSRPLDETTCDRYVEFGWVRKGEERRQNVHNRCLLTFRDITVQFSAVHYTVGKSHLIKEIPLRPHVVCVYPQYRHITHRLALSLLNWSYHNALLNYLILSFLFLLVCHTDSFVYSLHTLQKNQWNWTEMKL